MYIKSIAVGLLCNVIFGACFANWLYQDAFPCCFQRINLHCGPGIGRLTSSADRQSLSIPL